MSQTINQTQTSIPNFSFPFKKLNSEDLYNQEFIKSPNDNYLFSQHGLWHGAPHFFGTSFDEKICSIADGELVAYRVNSQYLEDEKDSIVDSLLEMGKGLYSTGFFLVRHKLEYPKDNKLTFFSLYMHTAKKDAYTKDKPFVIKDFVSGKVQILDTPKPIKAGEVIGLMGEYNQQKESDNKVLHLEIFTSDDIKKFIQTSQIYYQSDISPNKPKAKNLEVPANIKKYKDQNYTLVKLIKNANIRESFSNTSPTYKNSPTPKGTTVFIDKNTKTKVEEYTRYKVLQIGDVDVNSKNLTIADIAFEIKRDTNAYAENGIVEQKLNLTNVEKKVGANGITYVKIDNDNYVMQRDCKQSHPVTFSWARVFEIDSKDHISIFDDMKNYVLPTEHQTDDVKINQSFKELFKMIDTDQDGKMEVQEISEATQNIEIKKVTNNYIVKHSSEWDKTENMAEKLYKIMDENQDKFDDINTLLKHYENEEKRIYNLSFFEECKDKIEGFPKDDKVYVMNVIGLVGAFGVGTISKVAIIKAYLQMIKHGEGTVGDSGYEKLFGGKSFIKDYGKDWSSHPNVKVSNSGITSSASGAYQILNNKPREGQGTWDFILNLRKNLNLEEKLKLVDFSPKSQDLYAVLLLKYKNPKGWKLLLQNKIEEATNDAYSYEWASLPTSNNIGRYGQPAKKMKEVLDLFNNYYEKEIKCVTTLFASNEDIEYLINL